MDMKFYLSSYKIGNKVNRLKKMLPKNRKTAYIPNALDGYPDLERSEESKRKDIAQLTELGLEVELIDLRKYFGKQKELSKKLSAFGVIWVRGGNTFVLRQAMALSGFDKIFKQLLNKKDVLYGGYSAGICILAPTLHGLELVDNKKQRPYGKKSKVMWQGLNVLDYCIIPHYKSDHPETKLVDKTVEYCIKNKILFKTLRDGEVIIIDDKSKEG